MQGESAVQIDGLSMPALEFEQSAPMEEKSFYVNADGSQKASDILVKTSGKVGKVEVLQNEYRTPLKVSEADGTYTANAKFRNGLNSFYVRVYGEDNITYEQYILNVIYMPSSELEVTDILLNDRALESFEQGKEEYFFALGRSVKSESEHRCGKSKDFSEWKCGRWK